MQIRFNPNILRWGRDLLQSLSVFYNRVQKFEHFEHTNFDQFDTQKAQKDQFLGIKSPKLFVEATKRKFLLT